CPTSDGFNRRDGFIIKGTHGYFEPEINTNSMKTSILLAAFLVATSFVSAQNTKKVIELPEFKAIYVNSNYTVYLKQTNKQEVTVEALTEIFAVTEIKVENGILMVNVERKPDNSNKSIWAKIDD